MLRNQIVLSPQPNRLASQTDRFNSGLSKSKINHDRGGEEEGDEAITYQ